jgi:hypothetical protein
MKESNSDRTRKGTQQNHTPVEALRKVPKDLQRHMSDAELDRVLSLTEPHYVAWLFDQYREKLEDCAEHLAAKFYWLEQKYGEDINPWLLLRDAKDRFVERAEKFAAYKRPLGAMKRSMYHMACNKARDLRRRFGLEARAVSLDDPDRHVPVPSSTPLQDESLILSALSFAVESLKITIPARYLKGLRYAEAHFIDGKKLVDIAAEKGIHHSNVSRPMCEALRYLKDQLTALGYA